MQEVTGSTPVFSTIKRNFVLQGLRKEKPPNIVRAVFCFLRLWLRSATFVAKQNCICSTGDSLEQQSYSGPHSIRQIHLCGYFVFRHLSRQAKRTVFAVLERQRTSWLLTKIAPPELFWSFGPGAAKLLRSLFNPLSLLERSFSNLPAENSPVTQLFAILQIFAIKNL